MPGKRISELTALSGAGSANNDDVLIFDADAGVTKRISRSQLAEGMQTDVQVFTSKTMDSANNTLTINAKEATLEATDGSRVHEFKDVAALLADTGLIATTGSVVRTRAEGFAYKVAATGATDQHVTTAGGVKLYALSVDVRAFGAVGDGAANDAAAIQDAIDAGSKILDVKGPGPYNISTAVDLGVAALEMGGSTSFNGSNSILPSGYSFTNSERYGKKFTNSSIDGYDVYGNMFPSVSYYDVLQSVAYLPAGSSLGSHLSAISGYIRVDAPASGGGNNAVGLFAGGVVTVDNGAGWGINTLLQDSNTRAAHTGTGRILLGAELDFNVMSPNTQIIGVSVGGNSLAQPTSANAYIVNTLSQTFGYKWTTGFASFDGCANNALSVGMTAGTGNNLASQNVLFSWSNGSGVKNNIILQASSGFLQVFNGSLSLDAGSLFLPTGQAVRVAGLPVVTDRRTGWTAPTGTATRTTFATSTVTTAQLAERLKALIDDLTFHGLIGT